MALRAIEFLLLFFAAPAAFAFPRHRIPAIPALWALAAGCLSVLLLDRRFDQRRLWDAATLYPSLPGILELFAVVAGIGTVLIWRYAPKTFLDLPRSRPLLWVAVMVLYPVISVYPQGIVYRAFLFERYRDLFGGGWGMVLASAAAFACVHLVFRNWLAVGLTFLAGLLFAVRYRQTGSLFVSSFEHALYGCAIFTVGLGRWFYHGTVRR